MPAAVTSPPPPPAPTTADAAPVPTVAPTPVPTPAPTFDVAAAAPTPVPTNAAGLHETARSRTRVILKPFPVVRMRGVLTTTGAKTQCCSACGRRRACRITLRCTGQELPRQPWSRSAGARAGSTRMSRFERVCARGVKHHDP